MKSIQHRTYSMTGMIHPYGLSHLSYHETLVEYDVHVAFQNTTSQPPLRYFARVTRACLAS